MTVISIIVPAYNEERSILGVLERVAAEKLAGFTFEVIVVDDGSRDKTHDLVASRPELFARLIRRAANGGKGAAIRDGLNAATGEYVLIQDADLEYDPADYARLLKPIVLHHADVVMGSRFVAPELTRVSYLAHKLGNRFITLLFNILNNTTFTDIYSGFLVYKRGLLKPAELRTSGWQQHAEMLTKVTRRAIVIYEVPVSYHGRTYAEGKKIRARHAVEIIFTIIIERFRSR